MWHGGDGAGIAEEELDRESGLSAAIKVQI